MYVEGWEYTAPDGSRVRHVQAHVQAPQVAPPQVAVRAAGWVLAAALLALWAAFLVHPWRFSLWWPPARRVVEPLWVVGWVLTPLWVLSACIVGLGDAMRG